MFAREAQVYLLALQADTLTPEGYERMNAAFEFFLAGVNNALLHSDYLADQCLSLADIAFMCDFTQSQRELYFTRALQAKGFAPISGGLATTLHEEFEGAPNDYPEVEKYVQRMLKHPQIEEDLGAYVQDLKDKLQVALAT